MFIPLLLLGTAGTRVYLRSPVTLAYAPHIGPVYSVDCSPFHRNVFISCSMDTTVNIFSMLQVSIKYDNILVKLSCWFLPAVKPQYSGHMWERGNISVVSYLLLDVSIVGRCLLLGGGGVH